MPMGDSAGRSAGNRTGEGATRRNTPRERADIDPPWAVQAQAPPFLRVASWLVLAALSALIIVVGVLATR